MRAYLTLVLIASAGLASGCAKEEAYEKPLTPVRVQAVERAGATPGIRYSAGIEPKTRVDLAFKSGGYIEELARVEGREIQDGDRVTRGMVLARIKLTDYAEKINQARSVLAEAEAAQVATKAAYDRASQLFQAKSIARPEFEQAQAAYDTVQAKLAGARALVHEAENAQTDSALSAPIDGIVLKRLIEVGSLVGPGVGGFVLGDVSSVKAVFGAPDTMLSTLKVGADAPITTEAVPNRQFVGRITKIAPTADARSRVFDVELTIPNADGALRVGMVAVVQVDAAKAAAAAVTTPLVVPLAAIVRAPDTPDHYAVYVVEGTGSKTIARRRNVTLGDMMGNRIAVVDGLAEGDRVIVSGATIVTDGEAVNVTM